MMRRMLKPGVLALAGLAALTAVPAAAQQGNCARDTLQDVANRYVKAQHDGSVFALPVGEWVDYRENYQLVSTTTGELAALSEGPDECDLHPADTSGNAFAVRIHDEEPWNWLAFDAFPDGTPYLYLGGRAVPLVSRSAE